MVINQEDSINSTPVPKNYKETVLKIFHNSYLRFVFKKFVFYLAILFFSLSLVWYIPRLNPINPLTALVQSVGSGSWVTARQA